MIDDDQPIAQPRGFFHIVGGQQDGNPPSPKFFKARPQLVPRLGSRARWWVGPGLKGPDLDEGTGQDERRIIPPGELADGCIRAMAEGDESRSSTPFSGPPSWGYRNTRAKHLQVLEDGQIRIHAVFLLADTDAGLSGAVPGIFQAPNTFKLPPRHGRETINHAGS